MSHSDYIVLSAVGLITAYIVFASNSLLISSVAAGSCVATIYQIWRNNQ